MHDRTHETIGSHLKDKRVSGAIVLVLVFLSAFLLVKTISEIKAFRFIGGGVPVSNTITVSGEGEVFAVPDTATFTFSVVEERVTVEEAQNAATERINDLIAFLEREGVEGKDIKTVSYNVFPRYEFRQTGGVAEPAIFPPSPGERVLVGFEVWQSVEVKVRDTERAGELLSGIGGRGVSEISGLQFAIDDEEALRAEARTEAIENAKEKAEMLADDLDVRLARVVSFSEFDQGFFPRVGFTEAIGGDSGTAVSAIAPEIPVGENKIVLNVSITYEIR